MRSNPIVAVAILGQRKASLLPEVPSVFDRVKLSPEQGRWLQFRDAESQFIGANWTPQNFGSSSLLSRADYRATLVKQRVLTLLAYLQNYPASGR